MDKDIKQMLTTTFTTKSNGRSPMFVLQEGRILKTTRRGEYLFYGDLYSEHNNLINPQMKKICPIFYGSGQIQNPNFNKNEEQKHNENQKQQKQQQCKSKLKKKKQEPTVKYCILQNLAYQYSQPSFIDFKLGRKIFDENKSHHDSAHDDFKRDWRLSGYTIHQPLINKTLTADRKICQSLTSEQILSIVTQYFKTGKQVSNQRIKNAILQLDQIIKIFSEVKGVKLCSMSLLFLYDSKDQNNSDIKLRLIDFDRYAKMQNKEERDQDRLTGLKKIREILIGVIQKPQVNEQKEKKEIKLA